MLTRQGMIGEIRDMIDAIHEAGQFELAREVLGGIDRFNFSAVSDYAVQTMWSRLLWLTKGGAA